jgi:hydrogenase maturation protease
MVRTLSILLRRRARAAHLILVAGIGNIFFADDAFGVEVAHHLSSMPLPDGARVIDFGIRSMHLAFELTSAPDLLVVIDATSRGGVPGDLYLIDPADEAPHEESMSPHGMDLASVFEMVRTLGSSPPRTRIVGCEPEILEEGAPMSSVVRGAIPEAIRMVLDLIEAETQHDDSKT